MGATRRDREGKSAAKSALFAAKSENIAAKSLQNASDPNNFEANWINIAAKRKTSRRC